MLITLKILIIFIGIVVGLLLLFIYSACAISSWYRKEEEEYEKKHKKHNKKNKMAKN